MLELKNINKSFGDVRVLTGVNLRLEKGFVYTLKGGNGSGKTTLINIISGFLKPDAGSVELKGKKIIRFLPFRVNRLGVGRTFQDLRLAAQMTVYENILLAMEKRKKNDTFIVVEHKRQLMEEVVNKEVELELRTVKLRNG